MSDYSTNLGFLLKLASKPIELELKGPLKRAQNGYCYLELPRSIRTSFLGLIRSIAPGAHIPEPKDNDHDIGAHISVINKKEMDTSELKELNKEFPFTIEGLDIIEDPEGWPEIKTCYTIRCESKALEKFRQSNGLPKRYKDHNFHITLAVVDR